MSESHAWGEERILTHLPAARNLYKALVENNPGAPIPAPRFISVWPSEICQLSCSYCFFSETNADKSHTYIDTAAFINWLREAKDAGAEALEFSGGGEPTLHPEFEHIFKMAYNLGFNLGVITHACGDMPLEEISRHFKYVRCGLDAATVETHDAIKRNKRKNYWFPRAIENIKELIRLRNAKAEKDFTVGIKVVLNTINLHELEAMIELAQSLDVNYIQIKREHSSDHDIPVSEFERIESVMKANEWNGRTRVAGTMMHAKAATKCFMSPIHTVVTATGKILQCCFFENRPIGNINQPFWQTWGSEEHRAVIEKTTVQECSAVDCRFNFYNSKMKALIEDPLASASFI